MTYPDVPIVRVGYMAPRLPYPVNVHLPPVSEPETREQARLIGRELDIIVPQDPTRHEKLGRFLNSWGALESTLTLLLSRLTQLDLRDSHLVLPKLGTRNALDLLDGLGRRKLSKESVRALTALVDRTGKLNTKRNILVHGQWVLEANVIVRRGEAHLITQFLRETTPLDPEDAKALGNPRNQKERVRYTFTLKRIDAARRDTDKLNIDIGHFVGSMRGREIPLDELGQRLIEAAPYQVTYKSR
jgi:hypothetical protein